MNERNVRKLGIAKRNCLCERVVHVYHMALKKLLDGKKLIVLKILWRRLARSRSTSFKTRKIWSNAELKIMNEYSWFRFSWLFCLCGEKIIIVFFKIEKWRVQVSIFSIFKMPSLYWNDPSVLFIHILLQIRCFRVLFLT